MERKPQSENVADAEPLAFAPRHADGLSMTGVCVNRKGDGIRQPDASMAHHFLDVDGLAKYLGINRSWIYDRTGESSDDRIPHFKFGKYLRFDINSDEFRAWLNRNFKN
jgi:hypothetical protein